MKKGNLLVVDDEPLIRKRMKQNLEEYANEIYLAENGIDALKKLAENDVHCVICDINMPKMNGVEVIKKIREDKNEVPFIFYTGHGSHELMKEAAKYGAFDFLHKPNLDGLEEVVSRGLNEGFKRTQDEDASDDQDYLSEYQKLLKQLGE